jgi:nucleoside-diphosphate-sugar epimerase
MRIAVTGATGFIGRHLVSHLTARGDEVIQVARPLERKAVAKAIGSAETVVHLAGVVSTAREEDYVTVNVEGTRAVAEAARERGARLVHVSSLAAAGAAPAHAPRREDDPPAPMTAYGRSKLGGEHTIEAVSGLHWTILRPGVVYGSRDRALLPLFALAARGLLPLIGRPSAAYTFVHVSDTVRAIAAAVDRNPAGEVVFVGHPQPVTTRALLEGVRNAVGTRALIVRVPLPVLRLVALVGDVGGALRGRPLPMNSRRYAELSTEGFVCRVDRLRDRLGIVATMGLNEGLAEAAAWYRREGRL